MKRDIENIRYDRLDDHLAFKDMLTRRCLQLIAALVVLYLAIEFFQLYTAQPPV